MRKRAIIMFFYNHFFAMIVMVIVCHDSSYVAMLHRYYKTPYSFTPHLDKSDRLIWVRIAISMIEPQRFRTSVTIDKRSSSFLSKGNVFLPSLKQKHKHGLLVWISSDCISFAFKYNGISARTNAFLWQIPSQERRS